MSADVMAKPQIKSVRERLIDAAEQCLSAKGIRATTVSEVAELAGVSRGWLYRHFPDKAELLGAAIVRLNEVFSTESHAQISAISGLDHQITAGVALGRSVSEAPGALVVALRQREPEAFAACVGVGVRKLIPEIAAFWERYLRDAAGHGEIHADTDIDEAAEWVARVLLSLATVPGERLDVEDDTAVLQHVRRYVIAALCCEPTAT